jgi:hypothetical protein
MNFLVLDMAGGRRGRRCGRLLVPVLLAVVPCSGFFWQPLRCLNASWAARGPACSGNFSARTCARSQAEIDAYRTTLEAELNGPSAAHTATARHCAPTPLLSPHRPSGADRPLVGGREQATCSPASRTFAPGQQ